MHALTLSTGVCSLCKSASPCCVDVNVDTLNLDALGAVSHPAPQPGSGLPAIPDPAAFKEAVRSGGKLWPLLCHYLAPTGQACLVRQRLASDLRTAERCCLVCLVKCVL